MESLEREARSSEMAAAAMVDRRKERWVRWRGGWEGEGKQENK